MMGLRYNKGLLFYGTMRILRDDWDTNPCEEAKQDLMKELCDKVNNYESLEAEVKALKEENEALRDKIQKVNYAFYDRNTIGIKVEEQINEKHPELWGEIFTLLQAVREPQTSTEPNGGE